MTEQFIFEPLGSHARDEFACGVAALDRYFREQVTQDTRRNVTNCFVAVGADSGLVAGYFTLAASSIALVDLPPATVRQWPKYALLPAAIIGRLAVDDRFRGRGIGAVLLADAAQRAMLSAPAVFTLLVDAKDESAAAFYRHHGFTPLPSHERRLFLSIATARKLFAPAK